MNPTDSPPDPRIRAIPLSRLVLAPENARKTPADESAHTQLKASIEAHGLLENLVVRADGTDEEGRERFAVVAGGRRLAALQALAAEGALDAGGSVPCRIAADGDAGELSLAENTVRIAMHPADQVVAFRELAGSGLAVAAIAARFGVSGRIVEQRLRLGNAAPELLDACRAGEIDLEILKAFAVTTDHDRQRTVWERISAQDYRPSAWQVRRLLTEERVPAGSPMARFVGVSAYEAAGGAVLRDLFADEDENGVWFKDPKLLGDLAMEKLTNAATELATRWKWAEAMPEVDWNATARFGRIHPVPGKPTNAEAAEIKRLRARHDELANIDEDEWTEELEEEAGTVEARLDAIEARVEARTTFRAGDFAMAGCIATIGRDGTLQVIQGMVRPEDMPEKTGTQSNGHDTASHSGGETAPTSRVDGPAAATPVASPADPCARAREEAGVGVRLADDLRAIRTALVKAHLADDFEAAFDLVVFQLARSVFAQGYGGSWHALDIAFRETADRPSARTHDDDFAAWSPGEAMLADGSRLPFEWMEGDDDAACFAALRALPRKDREKLFAAAVARTVKGQLAFEHDARPELEATVARLGIDFAGHVRPGADLVWSRMRKDRIVAVARETLGPAWVAARSKYRKADLAKAMEEAFAAGPPPPGIDAGAHAAALAWTPPGFAAFDASGHAGANNMPEPEAADAPAPAGEAASPDDAGPAPAPSGSGAAPTVSADSDREPAPAAGNGRDAPANGNGEDRPAEPSDSVEAVNGQPSAGGSGEAADVPEFLRRIAS